ncbi:MAG: NUDIX hydrolase [Rhodobacteraceae bacterium]|nr:MAG: NUDIX hydrolase [Paracoccaceae bacterium]
MRFKIIPEVHLFLRSGNSILMLRRYQTGYRDGYYSLVAGHVDGNETFRAAMTREASEEAGLSIHADDMELVHTIHRMADEERLSLFFEVNKWQGQPVNMEPEKCDDIGWFNMDAMPENTVPYVALAIRHILSGKNYSEYGWH